MDSDGGLVQFVVGGGLVAVLAAVAYAAREIKAGRVAAKKSDLDSLREILTEQRTEMVDQGKRYDARITELETDLRAAEAKARAADATATALRRHQILLESLLRRAGIDIPDWQEPA